MVSNALPIRLNIRLLHILMKWITMFTKRWH